MKVPVRLIPKITVHTAAHDNRSKDPAPRGVPSTRVALSLVGRFSKSTRMDTADTPPGWVLAAAALDMSVRASARRWAGVVVSWVSGGG